MPLPETPQDASSDDAATGPESGERQPKRITQRGLWFEEFEVGAIYEYRPGRTVTEADNVLFTTLTMNTQALHLDAEYDDEGKPQRNADGRLTKVKRGGIGLLISGINDRVPIDGYTDPAETEKKIIRDAFKEGDAYFNSGDLVRDQGFSHIAFVDRLGDEAGVPGAARRLDLRLEQQKVARELAAQRGERAVEGATV